MGIKKCAFCGGPAGKDTREHVIPSALYPDSKATSRVQKITVPACLACNKSWQDDEPHFRTMLLISGEANSVVKELWHGPTRRSFRHADGDRRRREVASQLVPVKRPSGNRHLVYPARDPRVLRVVRKVIRGLCHKHNLLSPVSDRQVWADIQKFGIPPEFASAFKEAHAEQDILRYQFAPLDDEHIHSVWILTFFERTPFLGIVFRSEDALAHFERGPDLPPT